MSHRLNNFFLRSYETGMASHFNERHGLVTSYNPKTHLAKVTFQPEGEESSWLPIEEGHSGNGWGMLVGLTPGTGKGSNTAGGAGSAGGSGGSGTGGTSSGGGSSGQQQYQGDMVAVRYQEGDKESGMIVRRIHNDTDRPPRVEAGEMLLMHSLGARLFFDKQGKFHIYDKTSNQDSQDTQQDGSGSSSGSGAGGGNQRRPLKNAPPLKPQSVHIQFDGKGKVTTTSFQQEKRQKGQDPVDPNSQESPDPFSIHEVDGNGRTHTITTYQKGQGGSSSSSSGGGQPQPAVSQGDPGSTAKQTSCKKFCKVQIDHNKKTMTIHTYQDQSDNPQHSMELDNKNKKLIVTTYEDGGSNPFHQIHMDNQSGRMTCKTCQGGQTVAETIYSKEGHVAHNMKGIHSINASHIQSTAASWIHNGDFQGNVINATRSMSAPTGSVPGPDLPIGGSPIAGVGASPLSGLKNT